MPRFHCRSSRAVTRGGEAAIDGTQPLDILFERLVEAAGLPPIRLHNLRHVAATLMLAASVDVKVVSETLGHADTRITRDIYQSVLDDLARDAAEKVVQLRRGQFRPASEQGPLSPDACAIDRRHPVQHPSAASDPSIVGQLEVAANGDEGDQAPAQLAAQVATGYPPLRLNAHPVTTTLRPVGTAEAVRPLSRPRSSTFHKHPVRRRFTARASTSPQGHQPTQL